MTRPGLVALALLLAPGLAGCLDAPEVTEPQVTGSLYVDFEGGAEVRIWLLLPTPYEGDEPARIVKRFVEDERVALRMHDANGTLRRYLAVVAPASEAFLQLDVRPASENWAAVTWYDPGHGEAVSTEDATEMVAWLVCEENCATDALAAMIVLRIGGTQPGDPLCQDVHEVIGVIEEAEGGGTLAHTASTACA